MLIEYCFSELKNIMKDLLLVIHFAGGSSASFVRLKEPEKHEFVFIDLLGKEKLKSMELLTNMYFKLQELFLI